MNFATSFAKLSAKTAERKQQKYGLTHSEVNLTTENYSASKANQPRYLHALQEMTLSENMIFLTFFVKLSTKTPPRILQKILKL